MREPQETEINGATYRSSPLPGRKATLIAARVAKLIGAGAAAAGMLGSNGQSDEESDEEAGGRLLAAVVGKIAESLDEHKTLTLIRDILQLTVRIDPDTNDRQDIWQDNVYDEVYGGGNLAELFQAVGFAFQVNGFFGFAGIGTLAKRAASLIPTQAAPEPEPSKKSPRASTRTSKTSARSGS